MLHLLVKVLPLLLFLINVSVGATVGSICTSGTISLGALSSPSVVFTNASSTSTSWLQLSFCTSAPESLFTLRGCPSGNGTNISSASSSFPPRFATLVTNSSSSTCSVTAFSNVMSPLTPLSSSSYAYVISDAGNKSYMNVTLVCNAGAAYNAATLLSLTNTSSSSTGDIWIRVVIATSAVCPVQTFFCTVDSNCSSGGQKCVEGVCVDATCLSLSLNAVLATTPANFLSKFTASDCQGQPIRNLALSNFTVTLDGVDINSPALTGEVPTVFLPSATNALVLTTLLLDQSSSVVNDFEAQLVTAATQMLQTLLSNDNSSSQLSSSSSTASVNLVAVLLFDGSSDTTTLIPHTTNLSAVVEALQRLPIQTPDRSSTNLYGAILSGLAASLEVMHSLPNSTVASANVVVFTDGFDTSGRKSQSEALAFAKATSANVTVMSVGITNSSDAAFLAAVATSGYYVSSTVSGLVSTFADLGRHLLYATQDEYLLFLCIPMRSSVVNVSIALSSFFSTAEPMISYLVNASSFGGGCSVASLLQQAGNTSEFTFRNTTGGNSSNTNVSSSPAATTNAATPSQVFQQLVANAAPVQIDVSVGVAYFANVTCPSGFTCSITASGTPTPTIYALNSSRCFLSPYCSDFVLASGVGQLSGGVTYLLMLSSSSATAVRVSLFVGFVTVAPTPVPTTLRPATAVPPTYLGVASGTGLVDDAAVIVFVVFAILTAAGLAICFIFHWVSPRNQTFRGQHMQPLQTPSYSVRKTSNTPAVFSPPQQEGPSEKKNLQHMSEEMGEVPLLFPVLQDPSSPGHANGTQGKGAAPSTAFATGGGQSGQPAPGDASRQHLRTQSGGSFVVHHSRGGSMASPNASIDMSGAYTAPYTPPQQVSFSSGVVSYQQPYRERSGIFSPRLIRQTTSVYPKSNVDEL